MIEIQRWLYSRGERCRASSRGSRLWPNERGCSATIRPSWRITMRSAALRNGDPFKHWVLPAANLVDRGSPANQPVGPRRRRTGAARDHADARSPVGSPGPPQDSQTSKRPAALSCSLEFSVQRRLGRVQHLSARVAHCRAHLCCESAELLEVLADFLSVHS